MKNLFLLTIFSFGSLFLFAQKENKFSIEINYGLNGNFFVASADYGGPGGPASTKFYNKNFIGTIGGIELKYNLNKKSRLGLGYAQSRNTRKIGYSGRFIPVSITDFHITHTNQFYQFYYERNLSQNSGITYHIGLFYLLSNQQEIDIGDFPMGGVTFDERNFKNSNLEEGGAFIGIRYSKFIDTKFELGIKSRLYYLISTSSAEAITLTPTLTYHF